MLCIDTKTLHQKVLLQCSVPLIFNRAGYLADRQENRPSSDSRGRLPRLTANWCAITAALITGPIEIQTTNVSHEYINSLPIFGYDATINPFIMVFIITVIFSTCLVFIVSAFFSVIMYRILSAGASRFSPTTLKLQWMFYKALAFSLFSFLIFLISPVFFGAFIYLTGLFEAYSTPLFLFCIVFRVKPDQSFL